MKKVWFDITHLAQYNFYHNSIKILSDAGLAIYVTVLKRGNLADITVNELSKYPTVKVIALGSHSKFRLGIYIKTNILRIIQVLIFCLKHKPDVVVSNCFHTAIIGYLFQIKRYQFGDDYERSIDRMMKKIFSTKYYYCIAEMTKNGLSTINCPKEWAYLSPKYFNPDITTLEVYGVQPKKYLFVREVNVDTTNYSSQPENSILIASLCIPEGFKVILSLENRKKSNLYPKHWILINKKEERIHSLIYYCSMLISSGDSMAREAATLGVPSIYCGLRIMRANSVFINKGIMMHVQPKDVNKCIKSISENQSHKLNQYSIVQDYLKQWIDPNEIIVSSVME